MRIRSLSEKYAWTVTDAGELPDDAQLVELLGLVPLISAYFHQARGDMPAALRASFAAHHFTLRHGAALVQLVASPSLTVDRLASRIGVTTTAATDLVGALDRAGLVSCAPDPADDRRTSVSLRPQYRELMSQFLAVRADPLLRALGGLTPEQRDGFVAGLRAWAREVENAT